MDELSDDERKVFCPGSKVANMGIFLLVTDTLLNSNFKVR